MMYLNSPKKHQLKRWKKPVPPGMYKPVNDRIKYQPQLVQDFSINSMMKGKHQNCILTIFSLAAFGGNKPGTVVPGEQLEGSILLTSKRLPPEVRRIVVSMFCLINL